MKVLVTGGAGFIGSHVADRFLAAGHQVSIVDDLSSGSLENLPSQADFHQLSIRDSALEDLVAELRPDAIAHLAAQIDVRKSVADPADDALSNVVGTIRLAEAARRVGCKQIIFSSTGGAIYGEQDVFPATEEHPLRPVSPYGVAKLCAENYLEYFQRTGGPKASILRYANVYGPRQDPHGEAGVVAIFIQRILSGKKPTINGDGKQTRDFVFVKDVAEANHLVLEKAQAGVFNIGTGVETDINQLTNTMRELTDFEPEPDYAPAQPGEQLRSCVDASLASETFGWKPEVGLEWGLELTIEYFRQESTRIST